VLKLILLVLAMGFSLSGMAWLALTKKAHWYQLSGERSLPHKKPMPYRLLGYAALLFSLALCILADNTSIAILVWVMSMTLAVICIAFTLSFRPQWLRLFLR